MSRACRGSTGQSRLELCSRLQSLQFEATPEVQFNRALLSQSDSDRQTFAPFGATGVDNGAAATGFHANQEAVCTGAANLGGLVSAFHLEILKGSVTTRILPGRYRFSPNLERGTRYYGKLFERWQYFTTTTACIAGNRAGLALVDKCWINYNLRHSNL